MQKFPLPRKLPVKYFIFNIFHSSGDNFVCFYFFAYLVARVHNGGVVAAAEVLAYGHKGYALPQYVANKVNANLAWHYDFLILLFADKVLFLHAEVLAGVVHDVVYGNNVGAGVGVVAQSVVDDVHVVGVTAYKRAVTDNAVQHAFHFADVACYALGNEFKHVEADVIVFGVALFLQNGNARFKVGRLDVGNNAECKARFQSVGNFNFLWRTVAAENYLFACKVQLVEGVEHLFLRAFLAGEKLYVVHHKHVYLAVLVAEVFGCAGVARVVNGLDKLVYKLVAGYVHDFLLGEVALYAVADCVHKVGFAQPYAAPQKHGVVGHGRVFRDGFGNGYGVFVAFAHDKVVKGVLRNEVGAFVRFRHVVVADGDVHFLLNAAEVWHVVFGDDLDVDDGRKHEIGALFKGFLVVVQHDVAQSARFGKQNQSVFVDADGLQRVYVQVVSQRRHFGFGFQQNIVPDLVKFKHSTIIINVFIYFCKC